MKNIRARTRPKTQLTLLSEYPSQIPGRSVSSLHGFQILGMGVEGWDGGGWLVSKKKAEPVICSRGFSCSLAPWGLPGAPGAVVQRGIDSAGLPFTSAKG